MHPDCSRAGRPRDRMTGAISAVLFLDQRGKPVLMRDFRCGVDHFFKGAALADPTGST